MDPKTLSTPSILLDIDRVKRNADRIADRAMQLGARLRPHIKTHKCIEIARIQTQGRSNAITISTLGEGRAFAARGFTDITYAVPIEPGKFDAAIGLSEKCDRLALIADDGEIAKLLDEAARRRGIKLDLFLKVDCGYHRCGVEPETAEAVEIPRLIRSLPNLRFAGILTHAGHSYYCRSKEDVLAVARHERDLMTAFAEKLRNEDIPVPVVSIGSTPTITQIDHLKGIDEVRPGNYIFFDGFQASIGVCNIEDCALTVLSAVVHCDRARRKIVIDAGAIALSKDRGKIGDDQSFNYGRVLDAEGHDLGLAVEGVSQEHGLIIAPDEESFNQLKVGDRVRVLANHSCLTAAQHSRYNIMEGDQIVDQWEIQRGW